MQAEHRAWQLFAASPAPYCLPLEVTAEQLMRVTLKFLREKPQALHHRFDALIAASLMEAFPCPENEWRGVNR